MRAIRFSFLAALLLTLWVAAAAAPDPREMDILGLRLGMTRVEVIAHLVAQGVDRRQIRTERDPCPGNPAAGCVDQLTAPTHDGNLVIRFVADPRIVTETAWSIAYTLHGLLPNEPSIIRGAVLDHFGPPSGGNDPAIWCAHVSGASCAPANQPQMTFSQSRAATSTLTLIDPTAVVHAAP